MDGACTRSQSTLPRMGDTGPVFSSSILLITGNHRFRLKWDDKLAGTRLQFLLAMAGSKKNRVFEVVCPDCSAMLRIDADTGALISHTPAPRKRTFEDLDAAAQAMREQDERKESIFRQSMEAEKNKGDLLEKKFAEALKKAKDAPEGRPLREFDLD